MAFFNDMDRLSLKLLSPSGLELFAKNIQEAFNNGHKYRKIEDHKGIVEYLKAIRDGADGSEELFDEYIKVVDIREKVTDKKDVNDISEIDRIKHIEDRVESIQANVLVYGNDIVSKIIAIQDKIGMTPDADIYLKDIRQDLCDLDTKLDGLESMLKDIQKTLNEQPVIGDIHRVESKLNGLNIKQFTVDEGPFVDKYKFPIDSSVKFKNGNVIYTVIDVKKLKTGYAYDLLRIFDFGNGKRDYKVTGVLESKLEEVE